MTRMSRRTLLGLAVAGLTSGVAQATTPVTYTTIHVHDMHCGECAKKIARKLYVVPGVVEVRADVPKNIAYVVPQQGKALSPRTLWESVESAGFRVAKLVGPHGEYSSKPTR
jgi:copper chaperone CopZ